VAAFHLLWAIIISDIISQCAMYVLLLDNRVVMFIDKLFVSKFVFYVVLFELVVNKFHVMSCEDYWFISDWSSDAITK